MQTILFRNKLLTIKNTYAKHTNKQKNVSIKIYKKVTKLAHL